MPVDPQATLRPEAIDWPMMLPPPLGHWAGASGLNTSCVVKPAWAHVAAALFAFTMLKFGTVHMGVGVGLADALADGEADALDDGELEADGMGVTLAAGMFGIMPLRVG